MLAIVVPIDNVQEYIIHVVIACMQSREDNSQVHKASHKVQLLSTTNQQLYHKVLSSVLLEQDTAKHIYLHYMYYADMLEFAFQEKFEEHFKDS